MDLCREHFSALKLVDENVVVQTVFWSKDTIAFAVGDPLCKK
jgi:hypothetical protein